MTSTNYAERVGEQSEPYWLTEEEVARYTRRKQPAAQARVLARAGVPFRMVDNRPVVVRSDTGTQESATRVRLQLA